MIPARSKDISADWLNQVLHSSGFLTDTDITVLRHEPWGVGEGFVSDMARLTVTYDRKAHELPTTMIVKLPTSYESAREVALQFNIYEKEIRFYSEVAPRSPIRTPGLIYGEVDSENQRYVLILEDCSRYEQVDQVTGLDNDQTKLVALKLADFHARWWDAEDLFSFSWMPKPRGAEAMALIDTFRFCWDASVQIEDFLKALPEGGREVGLKIYKHYPWLIESVPDKDVTITHLDFRADNLFFDRATEDDPVIVFDWGGACISRGVADLAYLLGGSVATDLRRTVEKDVVRLYYERLVERGVSGYSFEECQTDYLKGLLFLTFIGVLAVASVDRSDPRGTELLRVAIPRYFTSILDNDATSVLP